ncbi:disulfide bond formation protein B [Cereibacter sphaeroides]|jgi:disulfide bond formation protein DsbB|uniref:disulfide bond formation protein B n=1 Tax=Cereibacter sphaeroides TaxID=1063 RepID=UPI000066547B|nr:disulfide bond formation protein B [Cereibacter sphaeroides]ABN76685.1 disulfide bond formation protein DsbB [Cereibacter sphaeroides ATCC 17029]
MTRRFLMLAAAAGSAGLLLGALAFQFIGGLPPCPLCLWQRWPHLLAVLAGAVALVWPARIVALLGALGAAASAGVGLFHVGVEQKWWEGLASCSTGSIEGISAADLLNPSVDLGPVVRCDEIAWQMLGISMAGWNVILSALLAALWIAAALKRD